MRGSGASSAHTPPVSREHLEGHEDMMTSGRRWHSVVKILARQVAVLELQR